MLDDLHRADGETWPSSPSADELLSLPMLQPGQVTDSLHAYRLAKRGNSLPVMAEAVRWGNHGARSTPGTNAARRRTRRWCSS
jgi:hypothetical protein